MAKVCKGINWVFRTGSCHGWHRGEFCYFILCLAADPAVGTFLLRTRGIWSQQLPLTGAGMCDPLTAPPVPAAWQELSQVRAPRCCQTHKSPAPPSVPKKEGKHLFLLAKTHKTRIPLSRAGAACRSRGVRERMRCWEPPASSFP